jgi:DNA modification methylase
VTNTLYYGDNLEVLRKHIRNETVDLCYIDPPFNSKRNYNQIYDKRATEDRAQAQAFIDTWEWNDMANEGLQEILANAHGRFTSQSVELIKGFRGSLQEGSLLAYLLSMTLRLTEIHRTLKPTGSFYLHCDPTASHYLKLVADSIFAAQGGQFLNEIVWCYNVGGKGKEHWARKHDTLLFYSKSNEWFFDGLAVGISRETGTKSFGGIIGVDEEGRRYQDKLAKSSGKYYRYYLDEPKIPEDWWVGINSIQSQSAERLGYPTQKPKALLERVIKASSKEGDTVLDAYCGCGTTVVVAEALKRKWIGIDITYQSISLVLRRIEDAFGSATANAITLNGIPRDKDSAIALSQKADDRLRKEFEKWALLSYTNNRAIVNEKKGADRGIDGIAYFQTTKTDNAKIIFQVKSGNVKRGDIATLRGDMNREKAEMAVLITLEPPTAPMEQDANAAGTFKHEMMGHSYNRIQIVTVDDILAGKRLEIPMSLEVLKSAQREVEDKQMPLVPVAEPEPKGVPAPEGPPAIKRKLTDIQPKAIPPKRGRGRPKKS